MPVTGEPMRQVEGRISLWRTRMEPATYSPLLLLPAVLLILIFFVVPSLWLLLVSFLTYKPGQFYAFPVTLESYHRFVAVSLYLSALQITVALGMVVTVAAVVMGYPVAYLLARTSGRSKVLLLALVVFPFFVSIVVRTYAWMALLDENGPINHFLLWVRLIRMPVTFLNDPKGVAIALIYAGLPLVILTITTSLGHISRVLEEAAYTLGAKPWQVFLRVTLPLSAPGVIGGGLLVFALSISAFVTPALMGGGKVLMLTLLINQQALSILNWPFAAAMSFVLLVLTVTVTTLVSVLRLGQPRYY